MTPSPRDPYPDALRAGALLVVVFGHWIATLPRVVDGALAGTDHLLAVWDGVARRLARGGQAHWWSGRALGLARPTVTYLAVLTALVAVSMLAGGSLHTVFNTSLTVHLWFLLMLLTVQALLPWCLRLDARFGLGAVGGLVLVAALLDLLRGGVTSIDAFGELGARVTARPAGIAWLNMLVSG